MTQTRAVVLAAPVRTATGTFGGRLKDMPAPELSAVAIGPAVERAGLRPEEIGTVVTGNVIQAGAKMNPGRQVANSRNITKSGAFEASTSARQFIGHLRNVAASGNVRPLPPAHRGSWGESARGSRS
jgi:acetyl-CoA C-acetyltransferase